MDKHKATKLKFKNLSEIVGDDKNDDNSAAGCSHYKRKAKFVVSNCTMLRKRSKILTKACVSKESEEFRK